MLVGAIEKLVGGLNGRTRGAPGGVLGSHSIAFGDYFAATTCYSGLEHRSVCALAKSA